MVDLTVAIQVGVVLAAFLFMRRMSEVSNVSAITRELGDGRDTYDSDPNSVRRRDIPRGVEVYEINGPFFFGAAAQFRETLGQVSGRPRVLIVRMRNVPAVDSTGIHALRELIQQSRRLGTLVLLADVHAQPLMALGRAGMLDEMEDEVFGNVDDALNHARTVLGLAPQPSPPGVEPTVARETPAYGTPTARVPADTES